MTDERVREALRLIRAILVDLVVSANNYSKAREEMLMELGELVRREAPGDDTG